jgi:hypothetical protein
MTNSAVTYPLNTTPEPRMATKLTLQFTAAVPVIVLPLFAPQPVVALVGPSRLTEVACEFNVRRWGPSHVYTKAAPAARRIFNHQCKTTFATQSANTGLRYPAC